MNSNTKNNKSYYLQYTIFFLIIITIVFSPFIISGKSLIGFNDSYKQHYPFIIKIKYFYENLLFHHKLNLVNPYDYMGLDSINIYSYYGIGNPFCLLFIGRKAKFLPYIFSFVYIFKIYLGGIAFQFLGKELNFDKRTTFLCSLLYIINPFAISSLEQFNFIDVLYQLPLLMAGLHQIFQKKKSSLFLFILTITFMCGFYWLYVQSLLLVAYALYYVLTQKATLNEKTVLALRTVVNTSKHYIIAFLLSGWIFVPSIINMKNMYRFSSKNTFNLFYYPIDTIKKMFTQSFFCNSNYWITVCLYLIPIIIYMIKNNKRFKANLFVIVTLYIVSYIPLIGYIFNGFSYPINRWFGGAYLFIILMCVSPLNEMIEKIHFSKKVFTTLIVILGILQPLLFTFFYSQYCFKPSQLTTSLNSSFSKQVAPLEKVDYNGQEYLNTLTFNNNCQMNIYNSMLPKRLIDNYVNLGLSSLENANIISGLDFRSELEALYNVDKYIALSDSPVPYGFKEIYQSEKDNCVLYKNTTPLHFGYTYDSYINESDSKITESPVYSWNALNSCFIEAKYSDNVSVQENEVDNSLLSSIDFNVSETSDKKKNISFSTLNNCEVYAKILIKNDRETRIKTITDGNYSVHRIASAKSPWIVARDNCYYLNIGYFTEISSFSLSCDYNFSIEAILFHKLDDFKEKVAHLDQYHLENVTYDSNTIKGTIDLPNNRILCLSIPYLEGWTATVDGKKTDIIPINGYLMGINLSPGKHDIKFHYKNLYLTIGFTTSLITLLVVIISYIFTLMKKRKFNNLSQ
ncbi:MAG: hypothetical protein E7254_12165 [Lachnospiraceae bacterium]|nr:hypothetical protein [Lachnospiraceae bacterium]